MRPSPEAYMATQHGLILRRQARECGLSTEQIERLLHDGTWIRVRRGVYTTPDLWDSLDLWTGRPLLEAHAASLNMTNPHVWSHDNAALLQGIVLFSTERPLVHVTRFGVLGSRTEHGVKHHRAPFTPRQLEVVDDVLVLDRARVVADLAREHGPHVGLAAADSALRAGVTRAELRAAVDAMACWRHVTWCKYAVDNADPGAENAAESVARHLLKEMGLGPIQTQFGLYDGRREVWCDLRVGRHVVEVDGKIKIIPRADGGVADRSAGQVLWEEKLRQDFVTGFHLGMSRLVWLDLLPRNWESTKRRVRREYNLTVARYGSDIGDLARYRPRHPRAA